MSSTTTGQAVGSRRLKGLLVALQLLVLGLIIHFDQAYAAYSDWNPLLVAALFVLAVAADLSAMTILPQFKVSGSFLALGIAMVILGPEIASILGAAMILATWLHFRDRPFILFNNIVAYAAFPLAGGVALIEAAERWKISSSDPLYYVLIVGAFAVALAVNFAIIALVAKVDDGIRIREQVQVGLLPTLPAQLIATLLGALVIYGYYEIGTAAVILLGLLLVGFQYVIGQLLLSRRRARRLAASHVGILGALVRSLDLRDQMTARHSAAVARYARRLAKEAGASPDEQRLVHTAGLLHDIGKFILPDRILLSTGGELSDEDWELIRTHPQEGVNVLSALEGYAPVSEIVIAHHERIDGRGYPRGLRGEEIPFLARCLSIADTYDVMTSRDTYCDPISQEEAIIELRRVAGTQLDADLVEIFIGLLKSGEISFRHGERADFDAELAEEQAVSRLLQPAA